MDVYTIAQVLDYLDDHEDLMENIMSKKRSKKSKSLIRLIDEHKKYHIKLEETPKK